LEGKTSMIFSIDIWLLPAVSASASSYLVCLLWERFRRQSAPNGFMEIFLGCLSFLMGAFCAYYRYSKYATNLENNAIIMFVVGASTTYFWLLWRRYFPGLNQRSGS
jgi:glucan phosphoethanolaminetransferase (alkaline phosphatase superfamily)